jgi:hypothetical protein
METWLVSLLVILFSLISYYAGYNVGKERTIKRLGKEYVDSSGYRKGEFKVAYINKERITIAWYSEQNCWVQIVKHNENAK